jgi:hypothetical protein
MLAYVFWHRPRAGVVPGDYERAQRAFHASIETPSACFRLARLPFADEAGYEDWYLVDDWQGLGELNRAAVDRTHRPGHDRAAEMAATGWGGLYELVQGEAVIPEGTEWLDKPPGEPSAEFIASLPHQSVWRRQLVLGPALEFCCSAPASPYRNCI